MRIGTTLFATGAETIGELKAAAAEVQALDSAWTNQRPGGWDPLAVLPALDGGPRELGTAVVPTYPQHPVTLATSALTVQAQTGGRLTLGIGPSHELAMTGWYGIPYTAPARHTREYLEVLRPLLRGEHVRHSGEFFKVDLGLEVEAPAPPVLLAALGPRMLEVARDLADGTVVVWTRPDTVADYLVPRLAGDSRVVVSAMVAVTHDPDAVHESVARQFGAAGELPAYRAMLDRGGLSGPADTVIAGDETLVLKEIQRFRDAGATDFIGTPVGARQPVLDVLAQARG
ncbi:TIGR03564 family F420-dependent LLM class oxidoreductase [Amycolatopsis acidicola]|uniref:TIGR03564 family F420-dependent LLM class oxidoreductase n=1 Tax=Amycolatopsis acidicola TaxID=2596893 RepID=A0A5N0UMB3_9PSEU|nr:TIGR03564 family F420-dependent LLM class oxidoreductase [Amycolatopsis acidicola]KAA9150953.1 TIGR03564 family F420-dependent LLM class oxidoreductase [Amycolatopsis acidicola]